MTKEKTYSAVSWAMVGVLLFIVASAAVANAVDIRVDYPQHIGIASKINLDGLCHPGTFLREHFYPIWHVLTRMAMTTFGISGRTAATAVTGGCVLGTWICAVVYFARRFSGDKDLALLLSILLMLASPIYLPFFNRNLVIGQSHPNYLHNPTQLMVKVLAFPCFILYARLMDKIGKDEHFRFDAFKIVGISALLLLATLAKPSFIQIFLPSVVLLSVFKAIKHGRIAMRPILAFALSMCPSLFLMLWQAWIAFMSQGNGESGVEIAFLKLYRHYSPNCFVSVLLISLFPLIMLVWAIVRRRLIAMHGLAWLTYATGWLEGAFLIEKGRRMWHGNFTWGYALAAFFIWFVALDSYASLCTESQSNSNGRERLWFWIATPILVLHIASGVCYLWRLLILNIWR